MNNKITDRILYKYILSELSPGKTKEIEKLISEDVDFAERVENVRTVIKKENAKFLKKFPVEKYTSEINKRAELLSAPLNKKSAKQKRKWFRTPVLVGAFSMFVILFITVLTVNVGNMRTSISDDFSFNLKKESAEVDLIGGDQSSRKVQSPSPKEEMLLSESDVPVTKTIREFTKSDTDKKSELGEIYFLGKKAPFGRLLEFHVSLSYEVENFQFARKALFKTIDKYGYIKNSGTGQTPNMYMSATVYVRSENLHKFLLEIEHEMTDLGKLASEQIQAIDHTENHQWQQTVIRRENIRSVRRKNAMVGTPGRRNWSERESDLGESEDRLDQAKHEKWKVEDRIRWAKVDLTFYESDPESEIEVPLFKKTFIALANFFLNVLNALIYVIPVGVIVYLLFIVWKKLRNRKIGS